MDDEYRHLPRTWPRKFRDAFRGLAWSLRTQSSLHVHVVVAALVIVAGVVFRVSRFEWCLLALSITLVVTVEMLNTALERLARAVDRRENEHLRLALDIGSATVMVAAAGAVLVGAAVFLPHLGAWLGWGSGP